jgi:O-methyltransferase involved in polyketide biosynthesis
MTRPSDNAARHKADLSGVSETALLTLYARAREARRPDAIIDDPIAIRLVDSIDYDFTKFGQTRQDMAIRARTFDHTTALYLQEHPEATVVALAEGFQTSFWRLDSPQARFRWLTVDLPPVVELRRKLLPDSGRVTLRAQSALDFSWMDHVDTAGGVFITAEGLLMYLQPEQARSLIAECANRFPDGRMLFDLPPAWFAKLARRGWLRPSLHYKVPAMPFSLTVSEAARLADTIPGIRAVHDLNLEPGRGLLINSLMQACYRLRFLHHLRGVLTLLEFD